MQPMLIEVAFPFFFIKELEVGQLAHPEGFTLWEAMSAIEMMDPKMDAGMGLPPELTSGKLAVSDIKTKRFTAAEVIGIIDELISLEMSWISGNLLCQTLFTCIYLHDPYKITSPLLQAYVIAVLKTANLIRREVTMAHVYEEEDFIPDSMGLSLCEEVQENEAMSSLLQVEDALMVHWRKAKGKPAKSDAGEIEILECPEGRELEYIDALLSRIRFRRAFYSTVANIGRYNLPHARKSLAQAITQIKTIQNTIPLGFDVKESFDPYVTRKLFSQSPPKPIIAMRKEDGAEAMASMLSHFQEICDVPAVQDSHELLGFLNYMSGRSPNPNVLTRSLMQKTLVRDGKLFGRMGLKDLIRDSIIKLCSPLCFSVTDPQVMETVDLFLERAVDPFWALLQLFGHNRARQHRRLRKLVRQWEALQVEAEALDLDLHATIPNRSDSDELPFHLSSWVYNQKLNLLSLYLLLGYELDLYGTYEHVMVSWYLEYLFEMQEQHLLRIERNQNRPGRREEQTTTLLLTEVVAKQLIFRGLFQLGKVLRRQGLLPSPKHAAYNESIHYGHRFRVFSNLGSPSILPFEHFLDAVQENDDGAEALQLAQADFAAAKGMLERLLQSSKRENGVHCVDKQQSWIEDWRTDISNLIKLCIANEVGIRTMTGIDTTEKGKRLDVAFETKYHKQVPLLVVKR
ncbi:hypothetical protein SpCBS45565_g06277 [Spizellomyces sp. 'palustris']|nr:hypothetical protein SpCBS45565_g06277 [Spizellomyces sp. 'palustris']